MIVHTVFSGDRQAASAVPEPNRPHALRSATPEEATPAIHHATCDLCDSRIQGDRYVSPPISQPAETNDISIQKCTVCPDFDTCGSCFGYEIISIAGEKT